MGDSRADSSFPEARDEDESYTAMGDKGVFELWGHFTTRGHKGRVLCVDAGAEASFIVSGGVDYTVRVWKYDDRYEAYDLVAAIHVEKPHDVLLKEQSVAQKPWLTRQLEKCMKPDIDWDKVMKENPQGVTAVRQAESSPEIVGKPAPGQQVCMNGPVLAGTAHGDLYILSLARMGQERGKEAGFVKSVHGLHNGVINDIAFHTCQNNGKKDWKSFLVVTASEDGTAAMLHMLTEAVPEPAFDNYKYIERGRIVDTLFFGGGSRTKKDEVIYEELTCLILTSIKVERKLKHDAPVLAVRSLGDNRTDPATLGGSVEERVSFATLTEACVYLWNWKGEIVTKLTASLEKAIFYDEGEERDVTEKISFNKHTAIASVTIDEGALLFVGGLGADGGLTAVWGFEHGVVGIKDEEENGMIYKLHKLAERVGAIRTNSSTASNIEPICIYKRDGRKLDIDQSGPSTTFAVNLSDDLTVTMWKTAAVSPGFLVMDPAGITALLIKPGREETVHQLVHTEKVIDMRVMVDPEGPALVTCTNEGSVFVWDLEGEDSGQIYARMRSMKPLEIIMPLVMLAVSAMQVISFAFGPSVPWKSEVRKPAKTFSEVALMDPKDMKGNLQLAKDWIFWPEMYVICGLIITFMVSALIGLPQIADMLVREAEQTECFREERSQAGICHLGVKVLKAFRNLVYLVMQLLSTILVVPMMRACAEVFDCVEEGEQGRIRTFNEFFIDILRGNPDKKIHLFTAPSVLCYRDSHAKLLALLCLIVPAYLMLLVPYVVVAGDAHYVPLSTLFDFKIWEKDNAWWKAAARKATDMHLAFLHPNPKQAFRTLLLTFVAKVFLPVFTTLTKHVPRLQMVLVTALGFTIYLNSMIYAPYIERKFCVAVQDVNLFTFLTFCIGLFTVVMDDRHSMVPVTLLACNAAFCLGLFTIQMCAMTAIKPHVKSYRGIRAPGTGRAGETDALLGPGP